MSVPETRRHRREWLRLAAYAAALALAVLFLVFSLRYLEKAEGGDSFPAPGKSESASLESPEEAHEQGDPAPETEGESGGTPHLLSDPRLLGAGGRIAIPGIGLDQPLEVMASVEDQEPLDRGPCRIAGTGVPGQPGNCVLAGHRSTFTQPFRLLDRLEAGDRVFIYDGDGRGFIYAVDEVFAVTPDRVEVMDPTPEPTFTLITCHPYGSSRLRLIVKGRLLR